MNDWLLEALYANKEKKYQAFTASLIPNISSDTIIGVRMPVLAKISKAFAKRNEAKTFLKALPHTYHEENLVHAYLIEQEKDYETCMNEVNAFLPYVNNWAVCDKLNPKVFKKHKKELCLQIQNWLTSEHPYTIRFAIGMLMNHFLEEDFDERYLKLVSQIQSDEYYVNMMIAWYYATSLAKQYESTLPYLEKHQLNTWVHNKTIQKAVESYRISETSKKYLKTLRVKKG